MDRDRFDRKGRMWFPKSLSALWLASCVMAAGESKIPTMSEDGIRSIPVCFTLY